MGLIAVHNYFPGSVKTTRDAAEELAKVPVELRLKFRELLSTAGRLDVMGYLPGLKRLAVATDTDQWNACYIPAQDAIVLQRKLLDKPLQAQAEVLMHEIGHRGQQVDRQSYKAYCLPSAKLVTLKHFLAMANDVHQADFKKNGIGKVTMAEEIFAESYSRFVLKRPLPEKLKAFWQSRLARKAA